MSEMLVPYAGLLTATLVLAVLVLVQVLVQDLAGIKARHVPGMPVTTGHKDFHFRAVRAHANTNENLPLWVLTVSLAVALGANPAWSATAAWLFAGARFGHMTFYYLNHGLARGIAFGIGLFAQAALIVICGMAL